MAKNEFKVDTTEFIKSLELYDDEVEKALKEAVKEFAFGIEGDAKQNAPVDSGRLQGSITTKYEGLAAEVGTNVEYAVYVEFGTSKQSAKPYLRPALDKRTPQFEKNIENALGGK